MQAWAPCQRKGFEMTEEIWKPVVGYEGWYEVSNLGRVKRTRGGKGTRKLSAENYLKNIALHGQSPKVMLAINGRGKNTRICEIVFEAFIRPLEQNENVLLKDGNPSNVELKNIALDDRNARIENETWMPVKGFDNYEISSEGRIRAIKSTNKKWEDGRILTPQPHKDGYLCIYLFANNVKKRKMIHKLVAETFISPKPSSKHQVRHWDGNSHNNRANNILWGTARDNIQDKIRHGTQPRGADSPRSKLSWEQAEYIRSVSAYRGIYKDLMARFPHASKSVIGKVRMGMHYNPKWNRKQESLPQ